MVITNILQKYRCGYVLVLWNYMSHFLHLFFSLQSSFVNRAALGLYPPVTFLQDLKDSLISVCWITYNNGIDLYFNNRVFLSRNYRLVVAPWKFDVLKTNNWTRRANMLVLRTSNFQGATITPKVLRHKHSIVFIVHH